MFAETPYRCRENKSKPEQNMTTLSDGRLLGVGRLDFDRGIPHVRVPNFRFCVAAAFHPTVAGMESDDEVLIVYRPPGTDIQVVEIVTLNEVARLLDRSRKPAEPPLNAHETELTVRVEMPVGMDRAEAARLLQRLIDAGREDAVLAPGDFEEPDATDIARLGSVRVVGATP
jgi:hypothetical protein